MHCNSLSFLAPHHLSIWSDTSRLAWERANGTPTLVTRRGGANKVQFLLPAKIIIGSLYHLLYWPEMYMFNFSKSNTA